MAVRAGDGQPTGTPRASVSRLRFEPCFPRSVGLRRAGRRFRVFGIPRLHLDRLALACPGHAY